MFPAKFSDLVVNMTGGAVESENPIEMVELKQKALTFQQPNERELKNEIRWIHCWNLWTELTRQRIRLASVALGQEFDKEFRNELQRPGQDSKESLLMELQALIVKKPLQTLSKLKTIRRIKEVGLRIDIWEKVRREGVVFLSFLQIQICSYKCGDSDLTLINYKILESLQSSFVEKILCACKNIDYYYRELAETIALFKTFRCHALFTDPCVAKWIDKSARRNEELQLDPTCSNTKGTGFGGSYDSNATAILPSTGGSGEAVPKSRRNSCSSQKTNASSSALDNPDIPDFMEPLFASRKAPPARPSPGNPPPKNMSNTREAIKYYVEILHQGSGWFFAWCQFTDAVLKEIKRYFPSLGSEVVNHMTKHINTQTTLIKGILVQVSSLGEKIRRMTNKDAEMGSMMTCVATLDDFVSLIESVKHEASYLIRYVEIELINLGVLDLNREPTKFYPLRLFRIRNIISMKDSHLLASVDYLYLEMGFLLEFIELQFCSEKTYVEKYGQLTADLFKKYTVNRREVIQEKENKNIEMMQDSELVKELPLLTNSPHLPQPPAIYQSPISRYQRAEDLRKWVEDSMKMTPFPSTDNNSSLHSPPPFQNESHLLDYPDFELGEEGGDPMSKTIKELDRFRDFLTSTKPTNPNSYYSPASMSEQTPPTPAFYIRHDPNLSFPPIQLHPTGRALGLGGETSGKSKFFQHIKPQYVIQERPSNIWKTTKSNANSLRKSMQKKFTKKR